MTNQVRENFKSPWVFVLAAVGSAAGLGNLWRFPYLAYEHGGGVFFLAYFICLFVIALPFLITEIGMGQITRKGAPKAMATIGNNGHFKIFGWFAVMIAFAVLTYYIVITSWTISFAANSFELPWAGNSENYFFNSFLHISDHIGAFTNLNIPIVLGVLATLLLLYITTYKGTKGITLVASWVTPLPFILLFILLINSVTLQGSNLGLRELFLPKWHLLYSLDLWFDAASQVLFSLSLGFGAMFAYGAILDKKVNVKKMAFSVICGDTIVSIIGGIIVFSVLGYLAKIQGVPVNEVVKGGIGLAFVVLPKALSLLPFAKGFFSFIFYLSLFALAFTSIVSLFESILAAIMDSTVKFKRPAILLVLCIIVFLISLIYSANNGLYILDLVDHYVSGYAILIIGIIECIFIGWVYDAERLRYNLKKNTGVRLTGLFNIFIRIVIPAILLVLLLRQVIGDFETAYGGYPIIYICGFGLGSLVFVIIVGAICNRKFA